MKKYLCAFMIWTGMTCRESSQVVDLSLDDEMGQGTTVKSRVSFVARGLTINRKVGGI